MFKLISKLFPRLEMARIFDDGVHLMAGKIGTIIVSLLSFIILSRIISTEEMGNYSLYLMIVNLALLVGLNWSDSSIVRHGREEYVTSKKVNLSFWARMYMFVPIVISFILLFIIFRKPITSYIGISEDQIIWVILMFVLNGVLNFVTFLYQSMDSLKKSAYYAFYQKLIFTLFLAAFFFMKTSTEFTSLLIVFNLSYLITLAISFIGFDFHKLMPYKFSKEYLRKIWLYSWPQLIGFPGIYMINYIDLFVIKKYLSLHDVGVYSVAYNMFSTITSILMVIYTIFMPLIVEYKTKGQYGKIRDYLSNIPYLAAAWAVLVVAGILVSKFVIPIILSDKYVDAVPSFNILLVASLFYFISICLLPFINAFDLIIYSQVFNIIKAAINIAADFWLVPVIGITGGAYGTLFSYLVGMILSISLLAAKKKEVFYGKEHA